MKTLLLFLVLYGVLGCPPGPAGPAGTGPPGFNGTRGPAGPVGPTGLTGIQGLRGFNGSRGFTGLQGIQGLRGFNGSRGFTGIQGLRGFNGSKGIQGIQGLRGFNGSKGAIGPAGASGSVMSFGFFYGLTAGTGNPSTTDYGTVVAAGAPVPFPRNGASAGGITRTGPDTFALLHIGVYEVTWRVQTYEAGQLQLGVGAGPTLVPESTAGNQNPTLGGHEIFGQVVITTTTVNSTIQVLNPPGNSPALTIVPADGSSTHANSQTLVVKQLA